MKRAFTLLLICLLSTPGFSLEKDKAQVVFAEGNDAYQQEDYEKALESYLSIEEDYESFELLFNIGNSYYRLDSLGKAILYYERAKEINSTDESLEVNLQIARQQITDKIEALPSLGVNTFWNRITSASLLKGYGVASIILLLISVLLIGCRFVSSRAILKQTFSILSGIALFGFLVTFFLGMATFNKLRESQAAIVMVDEVEVKTSPAENAERAFLLHEGTKVTLEGAQDAWVQVKLANGSIGWLPESSIENI